MIMRYVTFIMLAAVTFAAVGAETETNFRPVVVLSGSTSGVEAHECSQVTSQTEWEALWKRHTGNDGIPAYGGEVQQLPAIDFTRYMVVAVFGGSTTNTAGLNVVSVAKGSDEIVIQMDCLTYQMLDQVDEVTPFAFIVIPRTRFPMVLQVDTRNLTERRNGLAPKWKDYHRFAGIAK